MKKIDGHRESPTPYQAPRRKRGHQSMSISLEQTAPKAFQQRPLIVAILDQISCLRLGPGPHPRLVLAPRMPRAAGCIRRSVYPHKRRYTASWAPTRFKATEPVADRPGEAAEAVIWYASRD